MVGAEDLELLEKVKQYRLKFSDKKPAHSNFVVSSLVLYQKVGDESKKIYHQMGTNDEPCWIGGSICAERSAFVGLRSQGLVKGTIEVVAVYITSDSSDILAPGAECREFMFSSEVLDPIKCKIILANADLSKIRRATVADFYPYPFIFARLSRAETLVAQRKWIIPDVSLLEDVRFRQCYKLAADEARRIFQNSEQKDADHLQCVAACLFSDGHTYWSTEKRGNEYGTSLDAVTQLAEEIEKRKKTAKLIALSQVDCHGFALTPFGIGRAFLVEYGHHDCTVVTLVEEAGELKWSLPTVSQLNPMAVEESVFSHCK